MKELLLLDNYDSFTYNLVHYIEQVGDFKVVVKRNDEVSLQEIGRFDRIVLSPGPGLPSAAGIMPELIETYCSDKKILGVCLGHQALAEFYGAKLINLPEVYHGQGVKLLVKDQSHCIYNNLPQTFTVGRYHSWAVDPIAFPGDLIITATDEGGTIMSFRHTTHNVHGIQFHPESILSEHGLSLIRNWLYS